MKINSNFDNLAESYLFAEVARRTQKYSQARPDKHIIKMGIGDVTLPLAPAVVEAMKKAADELSVKETFKGYPEYEGYDFLRNAVSGYYKSFGVSVSPNEIFVNDGAKSDCGNIGDIFSKESTVLVTDPVYPVYVDTNIMAGRKIVYAPSTKDNGFCAMPDKNVHADIIYLCSPNNPTGAAYTAEQLSEWIEYALQNDAVILYDAAYEAFISEKLPRSIFAVKGARQCAIEFCSLSKTAGFTGVRCGYTVIPKELERDGHNIGKLWYRRQSSKFNGVSYPVQRAAEAVFSPEGQRQIRQNIDYYKRNASVISDTMKELGIDYTGGKNSPYIWITCPNNMGSWEFFDFLLENANIVATPGEGFGECGKGCMRFTSFADYDSTVEAMKRFREAVNTIG